MFLEVMRIIRLSQKNDFKLFDPLNNWGVSVIGNKKSGKSSFVAKFIEKYKREFGFVGIDLWSARDQENLHWCISDKDYDPIILIHPEYVTVKLKPRYEDRITCVDDTMPMIKILRLAKKEKRVICFDNSSYDEAHSYHVVAKLLKQIPQANSILAYPICMGVREGSKLVSSKWAYETSMKKAKLQMIKAVTECGHYFVTYIIDWHALKQVDKDVRDMTDIWVFKKTYHLPKSIETSLFLQRLYNQRSMIPPNVRDKVRPLYQALNPWESYAYKDGVVKLVRLGMPLHSHKDREKRQTFVRQTGTKFRYDYDLMKDVINKASRHSENKWKSRFIDLLKYAKDINGDVTQEDLQKVTGIDQANISRLLK